MIIEHDQMSTLMNKLLECLHDNLDNFFMGSLFRDFYASDELWKVQEEKYIDSFVYKGIHYISIEYRKPNRSEISNGNHGQLLIKVAHPKEKQGMGQDMTYNIKHRFIGSDKNLGIFQNIIDALKKRDAEKETEERRSRVDQLLAKALPSTIDDIILKD